MKINHLINIVYNNNISKANLLGLMSHAKNSTDHYYIFDKTDAGWVKDFLKINDCLFERVSVVRLSSVVNLLDAIKVWALNSNINNAEFVQVYAEDDVFLYCSGQVGVNDSSVVMYLPPMVIVC